MFKWRREQRRRLSPIWVVAGVSAALLCSTRAADKAVFSGTSESEKMLPNRQKNQYLENGSILDLKRSGSGLAPEVSPEMLAPPSRSNLRSLQKYREAIDRKNNWIFERTEDLNRTTLGEDSSSEEPFTMENSASRPRKAVERFLTRPDQASRSAGRTNDNAGDLGKGDDSRRPASPFEPERRIGDSSALDMGFNRLMEQNRPMGLGGGIDDMLRGSPLTPNSALSPVVRSDYTDRLDPAYSQKKRMEGFMQLLHGAQAGSQLSTSLDPINGLLDTTKQSLQPVLPKASGKIEPAGRADLMNPFGTANSMGSAPWAGTLGDTSIRTLAPSTLSPAVIAAPEPRFNSIQPAVFSIPQRKF